MIRFEGTVTAAAPITVSYVDSEGLPRTPHDEVVIHGGTFRGPLRKAAFRAVRGALADAGNKAESEVFSLNEALMLAQGVDATREVNNESEKWADPVAEARLRSLNPMLNLFGRWRLPGRLSIGELRAPVDAVYTSGRGARANMFERDTSEVEYLSMEDRTALLDQLESERSSQLDIEELKARKKAVQKEARKFADDEKEKSQALYNEATEIDNQIKEAKASRSGAQESIKHPLAGFEAIAAGTAMSHRMTLINGTDQDLGLLLVALSEFARDARLGGHRGTGHGDVICDYDVTRWPRGSLAPETIGHVTLSDGGVAITGDALKAAQDAFMAGLGDYNFSVTTLAHASGA